METILFVDDCRNQRLALRRSLRQRFRIITAAGGNEALQVLRREKGVAVIVSDLRMPSMDGIEFLARAKLVEPFAARIMLTGDPNQAATEAAINKGEIVRFLRKPCSNEELVAALDEAIKTVRSTPEGMRRTFERNLNLAIQEKRFGIHFQPIIRLADDKCIGFESLARWKTSEGISISPAEFIPKAVQFGQISNLGRQVLKDSIRAAARWKNTDSRATYQ